MILCPVCQETTTSKETRTTASGARRRRECPNGHRVTTIETIVLGSKRHLDEVVMVRRADLEAIREAVAAIAHHDENRETE